MATERIAEARGEVVQIGAPFGSIIYRADEIDHSSLGDAHSVSRPLASAFGAQCRMNHSGIQKQRTTLCGELGTEFGFVISLCLDDATAAIFELVEHPVWREKEVGRQRIRMRFLINIPIQLHYRFTGIDVQSARNEARLIDPGIHGEF